MKKQFLLKHSTPPKGLFFHLISEIHTIEIHTTEEKRSKTRGEGKRWKIAKHSNYRNKSRKRFGKGKSDEVSKRNLCSGESGGGEGVEEKDRREHRCAHSWSIKRGCQLRSHVQKCFEVTFYRFKNCFITILTKFIKMLSNIQHLLQ